MRHRLRALFALLACWGLGSASAADLEYALRPQRVAASVWVVPGYNEDFSRQNGGHIVNTGFIVAPEGVIVIDSGPSRRYGEALRRAIARLTEKPVVLLINTHHHPDHVLGNQAFADVPIAALPQTRADLIREGDVLAENLFRLTGDWMKGTEVQPPTLTLGAGLQRVAGRWLRLIALAGHSAADLAVYDPASGVLFAGDLVFNGRAPTTPHAVLSRWRDALDTLQDVSREAGFRVLVPGHGQVARNAAPLEETRSWLNWLGSSLRQAAAEGRDMNELLAQPLPPRWARFPVAEAEYRRSVGHLFPAFEQEALEGAR